MLKLNISDNEITWPGNVPQKPEGLIIPTFLKVMTIDEHPFVYARRVQDENECSSILEEEPCPWFNNTGSGIEKCWNCKICHIDLLLPSYFLIFPLSLVFIYQYIQPNNLSVEILIKYFWLNSIINFQFCGLATRESNQVDLRLTFAFIVSYFN